MSRTELAYEEYGAKNHLGEDEKRVRIFIERLDEGIKYVKKSGCKNIVLESHLAGRSKPVVDLSFLSKLIDIESFGIGFLLSKKTDIKPIYGLKNLLELETIKNFKIDISKFPKLRAILSENLEDEIEFAESCNTVTHLYLHPRSRNLKFLGSFKNLQYLRLLTTGIESLDGIDKLTSLKELIIRGAPKLKDINAASISKSLEYLLIESAKKLTDYSALAGNDSIKELNISHAISVEFIPKMKKIEYLSTGNVVDGNLWPLMESSTLLSVYMYPQKRHYSHKLSELENHFNSK
ncbi:hypothetical protein ACMAZF_14880 [Psychrobium sp. nBUS_13]|uniref:hypothetical protein n=1 Tax=Psychrobium sp. nBUS_13 TaxID=3395319 RepID=UPI003EC01D25